MTRLILGAGHVGRALVELWVGQGHHVMATARSERRAAELAALGAEPLLYDVTAPGDLPAVDVAVWSVGHDRSAAATIEQVYVAGLSRTLPKLRADRLLHTSSTSVYAAGDEVDEDAALAPDAVTTRAERVLRAARPDAIILRLAGLYGGDRVIGRQSLERRTPIDGADGWINFLHHDDAAAAIALAAEKAPPGATYNVADGHPMRRRDYYAMLAEELKLPAPVFTDRVVPGRRVLVGRLAALGFQPRFPRVGA